ncbi:uncharacterized protein RBU33_019198 isoform 3-T4 [Hipposideros larvatus]
MRLELHILSSRPPRPPSSAVTPPAVCTCRADGSTDEKIPENLGAGWLQQQQTAINSPPRTHPSFFQNEHNLRFLTSYLWDLHRKAVII